MAGWRPSYKQRCILCRKNMVLISAYNQRPICTPCQMKNIDKQIEDPEFKAFFDIKPELYEKSSFLRNIKDAYLRYGNLTPKQKEIFKKVVNDLETDKEFEKPSKKEKPAKKGKVSSYP